MATTGRYSAHVALTLVVGGTSLNLSHVGASGLIVRDPCDPLPSCEGELVIQVDDSITTQTVVLPEGIPGPDQWVKFF